MHSFPLLSESSAAAPRDGRLCYTRAMQFERMTESDAQAFLAFDAAAAVPKIYNPITTMEDALEEIRDHELYFVHEEGKNIGTISYQIKEDESAYISNMAVLPEYRGKGIARKAMEFVLEKVKGAPRIWLVVHPENEVALHLYESLGFVEEERIENYYGDGEPRVEMGRMSLST